jgi:hypothetical protein
MIVFNKNNNLAEININMELSLDDSTRPVGGLPDPMMNTVFTDSSNIFINVFHTKTLTMWHFSYNFLQKKIIGDPVKTQLEYCTINFPFKSFYDDDKDRVYIFYRQGQSYTVSPKRPNKILKQQIWDYDLGQMYLVNNKILMVKSSCEIVFFKHQATKEYARDGPIDQPNNVLRWVKYHTIDITGFIFHFQGDERFQLITDKLVYFYIFDEAEDGVEPNFIPRLEATMFNFMTCTTFMVDIQEKFSITYKSGQPNFNIFKRKYDHGFKELFDNVKSREGCCGANIESRNLFLISDDNYI